MQQSIIKFIALSYRHCSTCFGHYNVHHQEPVKCRWSLWFPYECGGGSVLSRGRPRLRTLPPSHSYGNQRLQRQIHGLLMMGIVMPETCWAVYVRQGNKFYDLLLHLVGCFIRVILDSSECCCEVRSLNWTGIPCRLFTYAKTSYTRNSYGFKICLFSYYFLLLGFYSCDNSYWGTVFSCTSLPLLIDLPIIISRNKGNQ
jgi:hypothetical protein